MSLLAPSTPFDFAPLACLLRGAVTASGDARWHEWRRAAKLAVDQRPEAIVRIRDAADAVAVVDFARRRGLRLAPQGTGLQAAALGDLAGTVLVQTDALGEIALDREAGIVRVGAGVTWGDVNDALEPFGLAALSASSSDVGVVGYTLGGGCSWFARSLGLASSWVTAVELVTGDGAFRRTTVTEHPELFWALRGGGGSFGVVTALEFHVHPIATVTGGMLLYPIERAHEVLTAYADWTIDLDASATTSARLLHLPSCAELPSFLRGRSFVGVDGAIVGDEAHGARLLEPLRALGPHIDTFALMPATRLSEVHLDMARPRASRGGGLALEELTADVVNVLVRLAGPGSASPLRSVDIRHLGGALARPDARGGAVDALAGGYVVYAAGLAPDPDAASAVEAAVRRLRADLGPWAAPHTNSNFVGEPAAPAALFPRDRLARLRAVQASVDPAHVICAAQQLI